MQEDQTKTTFGKAGDIPSINLPPTLRIFLSITRGPNKGQKIRLTKSLVTVGRGQEADIVIPDRTVSRIHAIFEIINEIVVLRDQNSTNGITLNGTKVTEGQVNNLDEIGFGDIRALITIVKDTYGLYAEETSLDPSEEPEQPLIAGAEPYESCLVAGYKEEQMKVIQEMMEKKRLSKVATPALSGAEFIEKAGKSFSEKKPVDLIITEVRMSVLNGLQASIAFRCFEKGFEIKKPAPIIFFTEMPEDETLKRAINYLKPAKYLKAAPDPAEFRQRTEALIIRLIDLKRRNNK